MLLGVNASISYAQETMTFSELGFAEGVPINSPIVGTLFTIQFSMSEYYYPDVFIEPFSTISIKSNDPLRNILNIMFEFHDLGYPITLLFSTPTGYFTSGVNSTTWQGRANQITITNNSPDPIFLNRVTVTLEADPELSFSSTFANAFLYDQNVLPALNNPHSVTPISYISSNQTVATVDNVTGNVTLIGMGDADITAIYFGNDTYKAGSATYHLTVLPPPPVTIIMNAEKYMTFYYGDRVFRVPPGVTAYTYKVNGTTLTPAKIYVEGDVIPKGQAVVLHAEEGAYPFIVVAPYTVTPSTSNLYGYDVDTSIPADANSLFYMLLRMHLARRGVSVSTGEQIMEHRSLFLHTRHTSRYQKELHLQRDSVLMDLQQVLSLQTSLRLTKLQLSILLRSA